MRVENTFASGLAHATDEVHFIVSPSLLSSVYVSVHIPMYICMYVHICIHLCAWGKLFGGQRSTLSVFPFTQHFTFWGKVSLSLNLILTAAFTVAGWAIQESSYLPAEPSIGVTDTHYYAKPFTWMSGFELRSSWLCGKHLSTEPSLQPHLVFCLFFFFLIEDLIYTLLSERSQSEKVIYSCFQIHTTLGKEEL